MPVPSTIYKDIQAKVEKLSLDYFDNYNYSIHLELYKCLQSYCPLLFTKKRSLNGNLYLSKLDP